MSSTELATVLSPDERVEVIKQTVAKGASDAELQMFLAVAQKYDLDPFAKEIWFIKEEAGKPGRVQAGRDGFLAIANRHAAYEGMTSDVVYEGDEFSRSADGVTHVYNMEDRKGRIVGAYALVYRSDRRVPAYAFARFSEYCPPSPNGWSPWKKFPSAMILKVAETAALKRAFSISGLAGAEDEDQAAAEAPRMSYAEHQALVARPVFSFPDEGEAEDVVIEDEEEVPES